MQDRTSVFDCLSALKDVDSPTWTAVALVGANSAEKSMLASKLLKDKILRLSKHQKVNLTRNFGFRNMIRETQRTCGAAKDRTRARTAKVSAQSCASARRATFSTFSNLAPRAHYALR